MGKVIVVLEEMWDETGDPVKCFLAPDDLEFNDNLLRDFYLETNLVPQASIYYPCYPNSEEEKKFTAAVDFNALIRKEEFYNWLIAKYSLVEIKFVVSPVSITKEK